MSNYPVNSFQNALQVARAVCDSGGANTDVQRSVLAHALQSSANSGAFIQRLAAAKIYGMIEGGRNGYRLTADAKRYFFPSTDGEKDNALLMLFKSAPIFAEIIKRFDGNRLPSADMLANVLFTDFKVPESWKGRVARFFLKAADDAGVLDGQGFLRYSSAQQSIDRMPAASSSQSSDKERVPPPSPLPSSGMNAWVFSLGGKTVKVESSDDLSPELWRKLDAYIQVLKPFEEEKSK
jgi:hypothetical protein